jgi:hypothetical protein
MPDANPRLFFNLFQTFSYGSYVKTAMDAHFEPYAETPTAGLSRREMEKIPRWLLSGAPASPSR